jgi:hypothetical protein
MNATVEAPRGRLASLFTLWRLVVSLLLAIAGGCLVIAFQEAADPQPEVNLRPAAVVSVFPAEGARVLRQERIGAQLADGFTGELEIDGVAMPLDQLARPQDPIGSDAGVPAAKGLAGLNEVFFVPGTGKEIERLRPGDHRATILFWDRATSSRERAETYSWDFAVS